VRPQPQIDPVGGPEFGGLGEQADRLLHDPLEELLVRSRPRPLDSAVVGMDEHEIDVAGVVELGAAELAECDHGDRGASAVGVEGHAPPRLDDPLRLPHRGRNDAVGDVRDLPDHGLETLAGDEVAAGDSQHLPALERP